MYPAEIIGLPLPNGRRETICIFSPELQMQITRMTAIGTLLPDALHNAMSPIDVKRTLAC
jgi:hypothetical protein